MTSPTAYVLCEATAIRLYGRDTYETIEAAAAAAHIIQNENASQYYASDADRARQYAPVGLIDESQVSSLDAPTLDRSFVIVATPAYQPVRFSDSTGALFDQWRCEGDPIAAALTAHEYLEWLPGHYRCKTTTARANYIAVRGDKLSYLPAGKDHDTDAATGAWKRTNRQEAKPARVVKMLLTEADADRFTDKDYETFTNRIKAHAIAQQGTFSVVSGEAIAEWYDGDRYAKGSGSLNNSCMRSGSQGYFGIYTDNPDRVQMVIMTNAEQKLIGRALLWTADDGQKYQDRIYGSDDTRQAFKDHARANGWNHKQFDNYHQGIEFVAPNGEAFEARPFITLDNTEFCSYPYCDTFKYLHVGKGLSNSSSGRYDHTLDDVSGGPDLANGYDEDEDEDEDTHYCPDCEEFFAEADMDSRNCYCQSCRDNRTCSHCADSIEPGTGMCDECLARQCGKCGDVVSYSQRLNDDGQCRECASAWTCDECAETVEAATIADLYTYNGRRELCAECLPVVQAAEEEAANERAAARARERAEQDARDEARRTCPQNADNHAGEPRGNYVTCQACGQVHYVTRRAMETAHDAARAERMRDLPAVPATDGPAAVAQCSCHECRDIRHEAAELIPAVRERAAARANDNLDDMSAALAVQHNLTDPAHAPILARWTMQHARGFNVEEAATESNVVYWFEEARRNPSSYYVEQAEKALYREIRRIAARELGDYLANAATWTQEGLDTYADHIRADIASETAARDQYRDAAGRITNYNHHDIHDARLDELNIRLRNETAAESMRAFTADLEARTGRALSDAPGRYLVYYVDVAQGQTHLSTQTSERRAAEYAAIRIEQMRGTNSDRRAYLTSDRTERRPEWNNNYLILDASAY